MTKHMKFSEYLDINKKLKTRGDVEQVADFKGKVETKPTKENKLKDAGGKGQDGEVQPYKGGTDAKDPNKGKLTDGFADKGDKKLKYEPGDGWYGGKNGVSNSENGVPGGKTKATWPKTKTQEWVEKTKNLSLAEFTKALRTESLRGLDECSCQDAPHNAIQETISVCKCNQKYVISLVREMKRNGLFGKLVKEMVNHPETFKALVSLMEKDETYARKLAKAMNEMVAPPIGDGSDMLPKKKKLTPHPDMSDMGDDDHDDLEGEDHDDMDMGDDHDDDMGDEGEDHDDMGDDDHDDMGGMDDMSQPPMKKKPKFGAHHNLMNAMKDHPALMKGM